MRLLKENEVQKDYFYIYTLDNTGVQIDKHIKNPNGYYDNKFGHLDIDDRMFSENENDTELFLKLLTDKLKKKKKRD